MQRRETINANEEAVGAVLAKYQKALNESDTDAVMKLYASDGVFMPQNSPSSIGYGAVRKAYEAVFGAITLSVKFEIAEIRQIAPDWGIVDLLKQEEPLVGLRATRASRVDLCCAGRVGTREHLVVGTVELWMTRQSPNCVQEEACSTSMDSRSCRTNE